jgi:L-amino acid N-acyltransferase YncA
MTTSVADRCAYAGVAEDSMCAAPDAQDRGVGRRLLGALVSGAEQAGMRLGRLHGRWRDVLLLERRSPVIG